MNRAKEIIATHCLRVRYGETDQMGVVYHPNYLVWFNESRDALMSGIGIDVVALERCGYRFPVVEVACRYLHSARYGDEVAITARLRHERVARMHFSFEVKHARSHRLLATGETVSVVTDVNGRLLLRLPDELRKSIDSVINSDAVKTDRTIGEN
ncbi:MAG: acyl-CoA thioesterase [Proteobacteria bacterium]|nr:acyl-CoA thioesterase [Desulfocapsa sp.]MBU4030520.1 acyl-CoA thioesterase [Pseudomonadota bacterium]MBU4044690.1 acyl-CoA thioesterase [Pseudomonadota bacterium]